MNSISLLVRVGGEEGRERGRERPCFVCFKIKLLWMRLLKWKVHQELNSEEFTPVHPFLSFLGVPRDRYPRFILVATERY